ncbi:DJ-1/PfpI family protein [Polyangium sorediatum]|uniref:DJ-1/PfpI family protein n=1 Tax=Polyangium sorediatum TaxID=889274 RepID=A0ABT6P8F9_9BACT|nr:DJ-1/PfpI family protein [Polyangium sorediatum]MDI1436909.1 DJ-1/PfpI family protein [Polyangium sorediatum]
MNQQDEGKRDLLPSTTHKLQIGIFVCPGYFPVDIIGLQTALGALPDTEVHLVWKNKDPITGFPTFPTRATSTFSECPRDLDVLNIGAVPPEILEDDESLAFIADRGSRARWVTSVCGGSLVLGAAGLLRGYRATSNFHVVDLLEHFGATPVRGGRVVEDRNRLTAGPVVGSLEIALRLIHDLYGEEVARESELQMEYAPHPPYRTGSPELAGPELTTRALARFAPVTEMARKAVERFVARRPAA